MSIVDEGGSFAPNGTVERFEAAVDAAYQRGQRDILREVAKLPKPWSADPMSWHGDLFVCEWCGAMWNIDRTQVESRHDEGFLGYEDFTEHPANDCLWPRAQQALKDETPAKTGENSEQ